MMTKMHTKLKMNIPKCQIQMHKYKLKMTHKINNSSIHIHSSKQESMIKNTKNNHQIKTRSTQITKGINKKIKIMITNNMAKMPINIMKTNNIMKINLNIKMKLNIRMKHKIMNNTKVNINKLIMTKITIKKIRH